ncbi:MULTISPECIES: thioredoxin [Chryseobacterium group]|uniref:thioredoxin n=1 Tax=Chryseobacterium group TaxID=2782232 RepID=UPI0012A78711|nr:MULTISPECIES: thioredoxin [Chryseobacterium group]MDF0720768.1 thioredoxin [Kaistella sp. PBT33-4]QFG53495.1 thioredoxin [Chryseobacterium sp.]
MSKFNEVIAQDKPVLVDFFAEWCGPCKMQAPILEELKKKIGDRATIIKVDVDKNPAVAAQFGIRSVPTLIIFRKGEIRWKQSGVFPANELERLISENY